MSKNLVEELINEVFSKARSHSPNHTKNALSVFIVEEIDKRFNYRVTEKTFSRYHDKYVTKVNTKKGNEPRTKTIEILCKYLGYADYKEYVSAKNNKPKESHDFIDESSKNQINIPQKPFKDKIKPKPKVNLVFKFSITLMLVLMLILVYSIAKYTFFISKDVESIRKISTNELPNYLQANHEIWKGKSNTGEVEYFPTAGKHPETGEKLKIVSNDEIKEIIKTSSAEVVDSKNVKNQDESAGELILNPNFKNDSNSKEIAILVFGEDAQLNKKVVAQLEKSVFEDYNSTESLIMPNNFTQNIKNNLITGNISILGNKLNEHTGYVCVVKANHTFRKSSINSQIIICDLEVMYSVYDSKSIKQKNLSKSATYTGQGFTKLEAQNNAIKRME